MLGDEDEPKDWELEEGSPPEPLERKWAEGHRSSTVPCPACGKEIPKESLSCLFCDARIYHDTGLLGKILRWLKGL